MPCCLSHCLLASWGLTCSECVRSKVIIVAVAVSVAFMVLVYFCHDFKWMICDGKSPELLLCELFHRISFLHECDGALGTIVHGLSQSIIPVDQLVLCLCHMLCTFFISLFLHFSSPAYARGLIKYLPIPRLSDGSKLSPCSCPTMCSLSCPMLLQFLLIRESFRLN